jgi:hypothetical protein
VETGRIPQLSVWRDGYRRPRREGDAGRRDPPSEELAMQGLERAARWAQMLMGSVLLLSGLIKVWEPVLFYWEVVPYTQLLGIGQNMFGMAQPWQLFSGLALLLAPFECALGVALLANWRPRWTMPVAVTLMAFFIGLMVLAWRTGATDECGCFGALVDRSPGEAAAEDVAMLALLLFGWWGVRRRPGWRRGGALILAGTALALVVGTARFVPAAPRLAGSDLLPGVRLTGLKVAGLPADLHHGAYLVELFSPRCGRCLQSAPQVAALAQTPGLPTVVALSSAATDGAEMQQFVAKSGVQYPIGKISRTDFFRLTWGHGYPRLAYIRDGVVRHVWEHDQFPTAEAVVAVTGGG